MLYGTAQEPRHQIGLDGLPHGGYLAAAWAAAAVIRSFVRRGAGRGAARDVTCGNW